MSIKIRRNRTVRLIDRILPEVYPLKAEIIKPEVFDFCRKLKQIGVDMLEVNGCVCEDVYRIKSEVDFIYRIKSISDISTILDYGLQHCIVDAGVGFQHEIIEVLAPRGINITVEIRGETIEDLPNLKNITGLKGIKCIRIVGLNNIISPVWTDLIRRIKYSLNAQLDFCPENRNYSGNALVLEALVDSADAITTSFSGFGGKYGYASTEEILVAANSLIYPQNNMHLKNLFHIGKLFECVAENKISGDKPIIGTDIFKYESGIHADAIEKNPFTYEPFDPCTVGQERRLVIGKHSGKKAVMRKLHDLGIEYEEGDLQFFLEIIRAKSMELGRSLNDNELTTLFKISLASGF